MDDLSISVADLHKKYREIFKISFEDINKQIEQIRPQNVSDILGKYDKGSDGELWQKNVIKLLDEILEKESQNTWMQILDLGKNFQCGQCAACCKFACSEFSYSQLKEKSKNGDEFASQFLSIFVPYESKEEVVKIYPEYIKMLEKNNENGVYFYHCPKVTKDNKCSDYENRPQICKDFPDNPLTFLPKTCSFTKWKEQNETNGLKAYAIAEIVKYYKEQINASFSRT